MSLSAPTPIKKFEIGIIVSRNFDDGRILDKSIVPHLENISHVHTNAPEPGGALVENFLRHRAIPFTIWPTSQHAFASVHHVLEHSKFVYIITDGNSKVAQLAEDECKKKSIKYRVISHNPITVWRDKVEKVAAILATMPKEDVAQSETIRAIWEII